MERAMSDEKKLTLRLPADLHEWVTKAAKEDRRSLNAQLVRLLEEAKAARETRSRP
jgi:hypothetical protein